MEYKSRMRIYLDSCSLQRPLDDQTQPRIRVETEAVLVILAAAQAGDIIMVNSEALKAMPSVQWMPSISPLHQQQSCLALRAEQSADQADSRRKSLRFYRPSRLIRRPVRHVESAYCSIPSIVD
jgi:hypothetical protein